MMKKYGTFILILIGCINGFSNTLYDQLYAFNFNWEKYRDKVINKVPIQFDSDKTYIQTHLTHVISILKATDVSHLSKIKLKRRYQLIAKLEEYKNRGDFPMNYYKKERIPVFIDEHNTHCAVGYLLQKSGYEAIAQRISKTNNYAWVKEIKDPELLIWQNESGLSLEELKLIQGAYNSYMEGAFFHVNRYEIPQKPGVMKAFFDANKYEGGKINEYQNVWCYGEGEDGVLNGSWIQNYSVDLPWIVGFFENGNRTGQWKEYYQGTTQLCRTENWRNDQLNGVRTRYNRNGDIIEEILFKNGAVVTKINYDLQGDLKWVRQPIDSVTVKSEVYNLGGGLIAYGNERIHNPGNLEWFQNIELTALNHFAVDARDQSINQANEFQQFGGGLNYRPLVEYKKEGIWTYYKEFGNKQKELEAIDFKTFILRDYTHFGPELFVPLNNYNELAVIKGYDSLIVSFDDNCIVDFKGYNKENDLHLKMTYYEDIVAPVYFFDFRFNQFRLEKEIASIGQYDQDGAKIGLWKYFDKKAMLYKTENYILPYRENDNRNVKMAGQKLAVITKE